MAHDKVPLKVESRDAVEPVIIVRIDLLLNIRVFVVAL